MTGVERGVPVGAAARVALALIGAAVVCCSFGGVGHAAAAVGSAPPPPAFVVALARRGAAALGDPQPTSAVYVATTHLAAVRLSSGDGVNTDQPVYLVVLTGTFVATGATSMSPGSPPPAGTVASFVVDAANGRDLDFGLSSQQVDIAKLGRATDLLPYLNGEKTPACGRPDLHASASFQGATGSELGGLSVKNVGTLACTLPATPRIKLSWHNRPLAVRQVPFPAGWLARMNPGWATPLHVLAPGASGRVVLQWSNWCGPQPWRHAMFRPLVELKLPNQPRVLKAPVGAISAPSCNASSATRGRASTIRVSSFVPSAG
jgi:hypothetical protein